MTHRLKPEDEYLPDGEVRRVRVPLMTTDHQSKGNPTVNTFSDAAVADRALDAYARFEDARRTHLADRLRPPSAEAVAAVDAAYEQSVRRLNDAHHGPALVTQTVQAPTTPATVADAQAVIDRAYEESCRRLTDAWRNAS